QVHLRYGDPRTEVQGALFDLRPAEQAADEPCSRHRRDDFQARRDTRPGRPESQTDEVTTVGLTLRVRYRLTLRVRPTLALTGTAMNTPELDPVWSPYSPTREAPWDLRRGVHLQRRAGFAAPWAELQRDLKDGPARSLDRVLSGQSRENVPSNFASLTERLADTAVSGDDPGRLKAWWVYRMLFGPDPLAERL